MVVASRKEMTETYDRLTSVALANLELPHWKPAATSVEQELLAIEQNPLGRIRYLFINILFPAYDHLRNRVAMHNGEREGVLIGLALENYRREKGKLPDSLVELAPRWVPVAPIDRINGQPLKYKIVEERPIVYSVGVDGDDDGGLANEMASPWSYQGRPTQPLTDQTHDGDWILWSLVAANKEASL
jgi:hypothetical protein